MLFCAGLYKLLHNKIIRTINSNDSVQSFDWTKKNSGRTCNILLILPGAGSCGTGYGSDKEPPKVMMRYIIRRHRFNTSDFEYQVKESQTVVLRQQHPNTECFTFNLVQLNILQL